MALAVLPTRVIWQSTQSTIAALGNLKGVHGKRVIDASNIAFAPGFINMLSWADKSLIEDGLSQSDIRQGVTLEVMGEGWSDGPLNEAMKKETIEKQGAIRFDKMEHTGRIP